MQKSLIRVSVLNLLDAKPLGFDGADLKVIARCDDGNDYAVKRLQDGQSIPLSEWVGHRLWRQCGLLTPDFSVLYAADGEPMFGSRIEMHKRQLKKEDGKYGIVTFLRPHASKLARCYPLDVWFANPDRHGRNFMLRPGVTGEVLLCIDWSRAWVCGGAPWGTPPDTQSNTAQWWGFLHKSMGLMPDGASMQAAMGLPDDWLESVLNEAPQEWKSHLDIGSIVDFWRNRRSLLAQSVADWLSQFS